MKQNIEGKKVAQYRKVFLPASVVRVLKFLFTLSSVKIKGNLGSGLQSHFCKKYATVALKWDLFRMFLVLGRV